MRGGLTFLIIVLVVVVAAVANTFFTVSETQQAIVLRFGEARNVIKDAGLNVKLPGVDNVQMFDKRILNVEIENQDMPDKERRRLSVDAFVRYKIVDPLMFYQSLGTQNSAAERMRNLLASSLRQVIATETIFSVLSEERGRIMQAIQTRVSKSAEEFGIEVIDVRILRADLPKDNVQSIIERMVSERDREAAEARAEGQEIKNRIESQADREREVILADAMRESEILRGEGDGERNRIYADAYSRDPAFFEFYRSMIAYERALQQNDTTMVLSPDSEFFKFLGDDAGK